MSESPEPRKKKSAAKSAPTPDSIDPFHALAYVPHPGRKPRRKQDVRPLAALLATAALTVAALHFFSPPEPQVALPPIAAAPAPESMPLIADIETLRNKRNVRIIDRYNTFIRRNYPGWGLESTKAKYISTGPDGIALYSVIQPDGYEEKVRIVNQALLNNRR